ncbi:MAG: DUF362 domain-containing protein [Candidatus Sumerlaeota bacterium]|nr:DUF362 domain-containing protein [Candidatus Sumerlaeota bacterium]
MIHSSRREFVIGSAAALAAMQSGILNAADAPAGGKSPEMAIAKWSGDAKGMTNDQINEAAAKLAQQAVEALGGMKRFVKPGQTVWVKPNIGWDRAPELAGNTNPEIVARVIKMCLEAGAKSVKMGDNTVNQAQKTYVTSGIAAAAEKAGAKVIYIDKTRFKSVDIKGEKIKEIPIYPEILECDVVINVPIVKHHGTSTLTMCMKNWMGVIDKRQTFHQGIELCLADISRFMQSKCQLHILDGVRILKAHGPSGGKLEDVETKMTVAAGTDYVALDAWGAELAGYKPDAIKTIVQGQKMALGKMDYRSLAPKEIAVS